MASARCSDFFFQMLMSVKESMTVSSSVRTQKAPTLVAAVKDSFSTVTADHAMVRGLQCSV